ESDPGKRAAGDLARLQDRPLQAACLYSVGNAGRICRLAEGVCRAERLAHRRALEHVGRDRADDAGGRSRYGVWPGGRRLRDYRHAAISGRVRAMGDGDPGRDLRGLRAEVPPRRDRRDRAFFPTLALNGPISGTFPDLTKRWIPGSGRRPPRAFPGKWSMTVV